MTQQTDTHSSEKILNVPPLTLGFSLLLIAIFLFTQYIPEQAETWIDRMVFIPSHFSTDAAAVAYTLLSYALLHFGWPHIVVNVTGLLAFGSGAERLMGRIHFVAILLLGTIAGALGHWALFPHSNDALGGASAGISALVGAVFPLILPNRRALTQATIVFVLANIAIGLVGMSQQPDASIAWQAHLFGFAVGIIYGLTYIAQMKKRYSAMTQSGVSNDNSAS